MADQWVLLRTFQSESEARVVESFLRANDLQVELLDTYMNHYIPAQSSAGTGMRLMIRAEDAEEAQRLLRDRERPQHLRLVTEGQTLPRDPRLRITVIIMTLILIVIYVLSRKN